MSPKAWYQSKTVWLNIVTTLVMIAGILTAALGSAPFAVPAWVPWAIGIFVAVLNIVLRVWLTNTSITPLFGGSQSTPPK